MDNLSVPRKAKTVKTSQVSQISYLAVITEVQSHLLWRTSNSNEQSRVLQAYSLMHVMWWSIVVSASDLQPSERSQVRVPAAPIHVISLGRFFTHMCLCSPSSINWQPSGASWKLNRHSTRHTSAVSVDLQLRLVLLRAIEIKISAALWATGPWEGFQTLEFRLRQLSLIRD